MFEHQKFMWKMQEMVGLGKMTEVEILEHCVENGIINPCDWDNGAYDIQELADRIGAEWIDEE